MTYHKNTIEVANDFNHFFQSVVKVTAETAKTLALQNDLHRSTDLEFHNSGIEPLNLQLFKFTRPPCTGLKCIIKLMPLNKSEDQTKLAWGPSRTVSQSYLVR